MITVFEPTNMQRVIGGITKKDARVILISLLCDLDTRLENLELKHIDDLLKLEKKAFEKIGVSYQAGVHSDEVIDVVVHNFLDKIFGAEE